MIKIIPYKDEYKAKVISLVLDVYENELSFKGYDRPDIHDISKYYQNDEDSDFWLGISENELIGTVGLMKKTDELAYIKRLIVKEDYRKQGLGEKLLQKALQFAKDRGFKTIYAGTVKENQTAIQFYEKHGFKRSDDVPGDITAADNSVCLKLDL